MFGTKFSRIFAEGQFASKIVRFQIVRFQIVRFQIVRFQIVRFQIVRFQIVRFQIVRFQIVRFQIVRFQIVRFQIVNRIMPPKKKLSEVLPKPVMVTRSATKRATEVPKKQMAIRGAGPPKHPLFPPPAAAASTFTPPPPAAAAAASTFSTFTPPTPPPFPTPFHKHLSFLTPSPPPPPADDLEYGPAPPPPPATVDLDQIPLPPTPPPATFSVEFWLQPAPPPPAATIHLDMNPTSSSKAAAADEIEREKKRVKRRGNRWSKTKPHQTARVKKGGVPAKVMPRHPDPNSPDDEYVVKSVLASCEVKSRGVKSKCYYIDWADARGQESWILSTCNDALEITGEHLEDSALDAAYDAVYGEPVADHLARKIVMRPKYHDLRRRMAGVNAAPICRQHFAFHTDVTKAQFDKAERLYKELLVREGLIEDPPSPGAQ
ncbi:hypothetical protein niasHT_033821 [Heterodera trifolii]|uniref:Uncharacterized protein n=1 Tax=Heterodera trifolii TaxID=157864 RepID=A0ABD2I4X0_9BILA